MRESLSTMVWCTVLFDHHLPCNKRLQNEREEECITSWSYPGETSHHQTHHHNHSYLMLMLQCQCRVFDFKPPKDISEITCVAKRRVWLTTTAIHHRYRSWSSSYLPLLQSRFHACFTFRPNRPGRIYSEHWVLQPGLCTRVHLPG
jgi:hypothetical protein